eukprot:5215626-Karenia_brevis.AAC.1
MLIWQGVRTHQNALWSIESDNPHTGTAHGAVQMFIWPAIQAHQHALGSTESDITRNCAAHGAAHNVHMASYSRSSEGIGVH